METHDARSARTARGFTAFEEVVLPDRDDHLRAE